MLCQNMSMLEYSAMYDYPQEYHNCRGIQLLTKYKVTKVLQAIYDTCIFNGLTGDRTSNLPVNF